MKKSDICLSFLLPVALLLAGGCKNYGEGTLKGLVQNGPSHYSGEIQGIMGVTVTAFDAADDSISATSLTGTTPADAGLYSIDLPPGTYRLRFEKGNPDNQTGYAPEAYYNVYVPPATTLWLEPVTLISYDDYKNGGISGTISDASDGSGLVGAAVSLRSGVNTVSGAVAATAT
ncbi:MAG: carboxypeptidase regulatory-like domain-containing protein, partial [Deltaproteobacteria bacterium]|nr:carboxypeptidase regulatory-like domain-containing protein [Deltaproteobacteria bacterium]